ncbi:MAG: DUF3348 family protein [Rubrivivax sp.]|nr:DUF3348 family protein [Rubrivivax sp.]
MPVSPRTSFNSSPFIRLLAGLGAAEPSRSTQTFAERWSTWLDWTDAISLSAVLNAGPAAAPAAAGAGAPARVPAVAEALRRVRSELAAAITADRADVAQWRSRYQAHQRAMDTRIGPLRAEVRAALAARSAPLARLAALDATLDQALGARERQLLATAPALLQKHFDRQGQAQTDTTAPWQAAFAQQVQSVLLAELGLRLQPVVAMVGALAPAPTEQPS